MEGEITSSTTVYLEDLFCTLIVDSKKGCGVATLDVPRAYLNADIPKYKSIVIKIRGYFVGIMCQVNPDYEEHVRYENE